MSYYNQIDGQVIAWLIEKEILSQFMTNWHRQVSSPNQYYDNVIQNWRP